MTEPTTTARPCINPRMSPIDLDTAERLAAACATNSPAWSALNCCVGACLVGRAYQSYATALVKELDRKTVKPLVTRDQVIDLVVGFVGDVGAWSAFANLVEASTAPTRFTHNTFSAAAAFEFVDTYRRALKRDPDEILDELRRTECTIAPVELAHYRALESALDYIERGIEPGIIKLDDRDTTPV